MTKYVVTSQYGNRRYRTVYNNIRTARSDYNTLKRDRSFKKVNITTSKGKPVNANPKRRPSNPYGFDFNFGW